MKLIETVSVLVVLGGCASFVPKPTQLTSAAAYRENLVLSKSLAPVEVQIESLSTAPDPAQRKAAAFRIVVFFTVHLDDHIRWVERELYPVAEKLEAGVTPLTAFLREENAIMRRRLADLAEDTKRDDIDVKIFSARAYELIGLLRGHVEAEERILLPLVAQKQTSVRIVPIVDHSEHE